MPPIHEVPASASTGQRSWRGGRDAQAAVPSTVGRAYKRRAAGPMAGTARPGGAGTHTRPAWAAPAWAGAAARAKPRPPAAAWPKVPDSDSHLRAAQKRAHCYSAATAPSQGPRPARAQSRSEAATWMRCLRPRSLLPPPWRLVLPTYQQEPQQRRPSKQVHRRCR